MTFKGIVRVHLCMPMASGSWVQNLLVVTSYLRAILHRNQFHWSCQGDGAICGSHGPAPCNSSRVVRGTGAFAFFDLSILSVTFATVNANVFLFCRLFFDFTNLFLLICEFVALDCYVLQIVRCHVDGLFVLRMVFRFCEDVGGFANL